MNGKGSSPRKSTVKIKKFIINWSSKYKRINTLSLECEEFEIKDYFFKLSLEESRVKFRERSGCLKTCRTASPSDMDNIKTSYKCFHCNDIDMGPIHWISCSFYSKLITTKRLNLNDDAQLIKYYKDIIKIRTEVSEGEPV